MYRLMKSERIVLDHAVSGKLVSYRHREIGRFDRFATALAACEIASEQLNAQHYILDETGKEYYAGTWVS